MINLPLINILDPNSIRSVGAFNRCVFRFGKNVSDGYQGLYVSLLIAVFLGCIIVALDIYEIKKKDDQKILIFYVAFIFAPTHICSILFWFFFYFYYGAMVNSCFGDLQMMMNEVGNILDSINTNIFLCQMHENDMDYKPLEGGWTPEMALDTIADEVEYQLMNYLIDKYGDSDENKLALIGYCKELLADETE